MQPYGAFYDATFFYITWMLALVSCDGHDNVTVEPGQTATLPCYSEDPIKALEWRRTDMESTYITLYRDGRPDLTEQDPSFRGRVELSDPSLKRGNLSLVLTNVTESDAGTYECLTMPGGSRRKRVLVDGDPINKVLLHVKKPDPPGDGGPSGGGEGDGGPSGGGEGDGGPSGGGEGGLDDSISAGIGVIVVVVVVCGGVLLYPAVKRLFQSPQRYEGVNQRIQI